MDDRTTWEHVVQVVLASGDGPARGRLDILAFAYLFVARDARTEAISEPGGAQAEQRRQLRQLARLAEWINTDAPDPEMERLFHQGDIGGLVRYVEEKFQAAPPGVVEAVIAENDPVPPRMEAARQLVYFDLFRRRHATECGVEDLDVETPGRTDDGRISIRLACPVCGASVRGSITDEDAAELPSLLKPPD